MKIRPRGFIAIPVQVVHEWWFNSIHDILLGYHVGFALCH
jgi:hypothetical protein